METKDANKDGVLSFKEYMEEYCRFDCVNVDLAGLCGISCRFGGANVCLAGVI